MKNNPQKDIVEYFNHHLREYVLRYDRLGERSIKSNTPTCTCTNVHVNMSHSNELKTGM